MTTEKVKTPDLGGAEHVEVIEVAVAAGDQVAKDDTLIVVESDKASMEIPSPASGKVMAVLVKEGDQLSEGEVIIELASESETNEQVNVAQAPQPDEAKVITPAPEVDTTSKKPVSTTSEIPLQVPDIGSDSAEVIELCVAVGDQVAEGDSLLVLESDKASMEVPAPESGTILSLDIKEGQQAKQGDLIGQLQITATAATPPIPKPAAEAKQTIKEPEAVSNQHQPVHGMTENRPSTGVYAGPAVRKMAREIGLDLSLVPGSGPKGRIQKADVKAFIKDSLSNKNTQATSMGIPQVPEIDFSQFGEIRIEKMSKLHKVTASNMHRSWLNVPHVTAFDEVDITDLESFRKQLKAEAEREGVKVTPLPFLLKACAKALKVNSKINASLHADGEHLVFKEYVHIGIAVDTLAGLMVPVIKDVDKKTIFELAKESSELAQKAKERKLKPHEMQGGCFTISSLGSIGGTGFTPIVNTPEVAILGVSKLAVKPVWDGETFQPKKMLPLSLSYDHRVINGADAGKFFVYLGSILQDFRRLAL